MRTCISIAVNHDSWRNFITFDAANDTFLIGCVVVVLFHYHSHTTAKNNRGIEQNKCPDRAGGGDMCNAFAPREVRILFERNCRMDDEY